MSTAVLLLVEDNEVILNSNSKVLRLNGYSVLEAATLAKAQAVLDRITPDLIILDIILPDGDGLDFCQGRRKTNNTPILFLTALSDVSDILKGYEAGGIDYISKPYCMELFLAKVKALLRFTQDAKHPDDITFEQMRIDTEYRRAYLSGTDMQLKPKEYAILELLAKNKDRYLPAIYIYEKLWALLSMDDLRTIHSHIYTLRKQLEHASISIENKRGFGYRLNKLTNTPPKFD